MVAQCSSRPMKHPCPPTSAQVAFTPLQLLHITVSQVMGRYGVGLCVPANKPIGALHCDQQEGEVIWVPGEERPRRFSDEIFCLFAIAVLLGS